MGQHPEPTAQPWPYWMLRFIAANGDEEAYSDLVWSVGGSPPLGGVSTDEADAVFELLEAYVGPGVAGSACYERVLALVGGRPDAVLALEVFRIHDRIASDPEGFDSADVATGRTLATQAGHGGLAIYFELLAAEIALRGNHVRVAKDVLLATLPRLTALAAADRAYVGQARAAAQNASAVAAMDGDNDRARIANAVMEVLGADPALAARYATDLTRPPGFAPAYSPGPSSPGPASPDAAAPDRASPGSSSPGFSSSGPASPGFASPGYASPASPSFASPGYASPGPASPASPGFASPGFAELARQGSDLLHAGDLTAAIDRFTRAEEAAGSQGREAGLCEVLGELAVALDRSGDPRAAIDTYDRAIELCLRHGDMLNLSRWTANLVGLLIGHGDLDEAERILATMLDAASRTGRHDRMAIAETQTAAYLAARRRYREAADRLAQARQYAGNDPSLAGAVRRDTMATHLAWAEWLWQEQDRRPAAAALRTVVRLADPTNADEVRLSVRAHLLLAQMHDREVPADPASPSPFEEPTPPARQPTPPARQAALPVEEPVTPAGEPWPAVEEPPTGEPALPAEEPPAGQLALPVEEPPTDEPPQPIEQPATPAGEPWPPIEQPPARELALPIEEPPTDEPPQPIEQPITPAEQQAFAVEEAALAAEEPALAAGEEPPFEAVREVDELLAMRRDDLDAVLGAWIAGAEDGTPPAEAATPFLAWLDSIQERLDRGRADPAPATSAGGAAGLLHLGEQVAEGLRGYEAARETTTALGLDADLATAICLHVAQGDGVVARTVIQLVADTTPDDVFAARLYRLLLAFVESAEDDQRFLDLIEVGLARLAGGADEALRAELLNEAAAHLARLGRQEESLRYAREAREVAGDEGYGRLAQVAAGNEGAALMALDRADEAIAALEPLAGEPEAAGPEAAGPEAAGPETELERLEEAWLRTAEPAVGVALARAYTLAGRALAALAVLNAARGRVESGGDGELRIEFLTVDGLAHRAGNDTSAALASLGRAHELALAAEPSPAGVAATREWGVALTGAGRAGEAVEVLEACLPRVRALDGSPTAEAYLGQALAQALDATGDAAGADRVLERSGEIFRAAGDLSGLSRTMAIRGDAALSLDDLDAALRHLVAAAELAEQAGDRHAHAAVLSALGTVHMRAGEPAEAAACHERAAREYRALGAAEDERVARLDLVECHLQLGDAGAAEEAFQPVLAPDAPVVVALASRTYFLTALLRAERGDWAGARPALRQCLDSVSRDTASVPSPAERWRRVRGGDHAYELAGAAAVRAGDATFAAEVAEGRRAAFLRALFGDALPAVALPALEEITAALPPDTVAAYVDLAPTLTVLCAGRGGWSAIVERPAVGPDDIPAATGSAFPAGRLDAVGRLLGRELWAPLLEVVPEGTAGVVLLPSARLAGLPLDAARLPEGGQVGERIRVAYAPSLTLLRRDDHEPAPPRALGQAVDITGERPFSRRAAGTEAAPATTFTGPEATVDAVLKLLRSCDVVHFAGPGRFDPDEPTRSHLTCAAGDGDDGRLTIARLLSGDGPIGASLVLLSACDSGAASAGRWRGAAAGLPGTLLVAGARQVIATHWAVGDLEAALLTGEFLRCWRQGAVSAATALAAAQRRFRADMSNGDVVGILRRWDGSAAALEHWEDRPPDAPAFAGSVDWAAFHLVGLP